MSNEIIAFYFSKVALYVESIEIPFRDLSVSTRHIFFKVDVSAEMCQRALPRTCIGHLERELAVRRDDAHQFRILEAWQPIERPLAASSRNHTDTPHWYSERSVYAVKPWVELIHPAEISPATTSPRLVSIGRRRFKIVTRDIPCSRIAFRQIDPRTRSRARIPSSVRKKVSRGNLSH